MVLTTRTLNSLLSGDEVLWQGYPKKGFAMEQNDLLIIPFVVTVISFSIFLLTVKVYMPPIIFIAFTIYVIWTRYIKFFIRLASTTYYVTSRKVIILQGEKSQIITYHSNPVFSYAEHPFTFNYGSVIFGEEENIFGGNNEKFTFGRRGGINLNRNAFAIEQIKDYKLVYNIIKDQVSKFNVN